MTECPWFPVTYDETITLARSYQDGVSIQPFRDPVMTGTYHGPHGPLLAFASTLDTDVRKHPRQIAYMREDYFYRLLDSERAAV